MIKDIIFSALLTVDTLHVKKNVCKQKCEPYYELGTVIKVTSTEE